MRDARVGKLTGRNGTPPPTVNGSSLVRHCGWGGSGIWDWRAFRQDGHHMVDIFLRELSMYCQSVGPFRTRGMGVHAATHAHARTRSALCSGTRTNKQALWNRAAHVDSCGPVGLRSRPLARTYRERPHLHHDGLLLPAGRGSNVGRPSQRLRMSQRPRRATSLPAAQAVDPAAATLGQAPRVVAPWSQS